MSETEGAKMNSEMTKNIVGQIFLSQVLKMIW